MAEAKRSLNVFVTGGAEGPGLATVRLLARRGHKVLGAVCDAEGALAARLAGALPVYPELSRASEILSYLRLGKVDAIVHADPQLYGGAPQVQRGFAAAADRLPAFMASVVQAAQGYGLDRIVSLSFGYLYQAAHGAAKEGDRDADDKDYAPMLEAEAILRGSGLNGFIIRSGYIYGGNSAATAAVAKAIKKARPLRSGVKPASWIHEDDLAAAIVHLLEEEGDIKGIETLNAADDGPRSPGEFLDRTCDVLGLNAPALAGDGFLAMLRQKSFHDKLLEREIVINSDALRDRFGWKPRHGSIESGLESAALSWRMKEAVSADDFYNNYRDEAAEAIASFSYDTALPEPMPAAEKPAAAAVEAPAGAAPAKAAAPPPSDGPTPWNEDDAKREERRRKALERKAKRAARQSGGS